VSVVSLYPDQVSTEGMLAYARINPAIDVNQMETPQFVGRCVAALALDPAIMDKSGQILIAAEVGEAYGIKDVNGNQPKSQRMEMW
jgi:dehydrogenase/reductase SDR family member 1